MRKLNILMIPDCWGWAHCFNARSVQKHSKHNIMVRPVSGGMLNPEKFNMNDVIFFFDLYCFNYARRNRVLWKAASRKPIILYNCGTYFGRPPKGVKTYAVCTKRQVKKCKAIGIKNHALLQEGVDTDIFRPIPQKYSPRALWTLDHWKQQINKNLNEKKPWYYGLPYKWWWGKTAKDFLSLLPKHLSRKESSWVKNTPKLIVGWAGNPSQKLKRYHLTEKLMYPVKIMTHHGAEHFKKNRSRKPMVKFYNSLDAYIMLMSQNGVHGCGLTLMEAMSCAVPVISTDIAGVSELVPRKWLVPDKPDGVVVKAVNKKLGLLGNADLRRRVGDSNRKLILKTRSWKTVVKEWDSLFEKVARK